MSLHVVCDITGCGLSVPLEDAAGWTSWPEGGDPTHLCDDHRPGVAQ